jgi:predicted transcriptional regulator
MPVADPQTQKTFSYAQTTVERAEISLVCSPFKRALLAAMHHQSVPLSAIAQDNGIKHGYTKHFLSELACDNALDWLIQVGVLRREVDGQGITDSYRLTPLGQKFAEKYQNQNWPNPSWSDRLQNAITRWLRLPF